MPSFTAILRLTRPIHLLLALLTYGLGIGIARYLGGVMRPVPQFFGGLSLLLLLAAANLLGEYFRPPNEPIVPAETRQKRAELRSILLTVSAAFITSAVLLAFLLGWQGYLPAQAALLMVFYLLLILSIAVPPVRLLERGFGEIITAFLIAVLTPAIAFLLFVPEVHPFLIGFTFPLFLLGLAWLLATSFENYPEHLKYQHHNLLMRLTWQRAVLVHDGLLIAAYFFLAVLPFLGLPFRLVWPALLTLPLAAYQIFMLRNIAAGAKPIWTALNIAATAVFGLTAYLITITFWLR
jgi:1,4-dihydroxy-2-naphthoate octaprenyltransferase